MTVPPSGKALQEYTDTDRGVTVEFLQPVLAGAKTVAIMNRPVGKPRSVGWVICHSFGAEQVSLARLEALVARDLAANGFPVLRYHGRGYGDSQGELDEISLSSHLDDARAAFELMRTESDVDDVGLVGARFGGLVAGLTADPMGSRHLVLWDPVVDGQQYVEHLLRRRALGGIASKEQRLSVQDLRSSLEAEGWIDLSGMRFTQRAYDETRGASLISGMERFTGSALIVSITLAGSADPSAERLAEHLRAGGATTSVVAIRDKGGLARFRSGEDERENMVKVTGLIDLTRKLSEETVAWALDVVGGTDEAGPRA